MKTWKPSYATMEAYVEAKYLGAMEFEDGYFEILDSGKRLIFGGACNVGFLESGYMEYDADCESLNEALSELHAELETYYLDGKLYCNRIVCNDRM